MNEKQLIKEKLKEGKKKKKEEHKSFLSFFLIAIIQGVGTLIIPQNSKWIGITIFCYLFLTAFIYIKVFGAYKITKYMNKNQLVVLPDSKKEIFEKGFKYFTYIGTIVTIAMIFIRKLSFWNIIAPIIYCFSLKETMLDELPPSDSIKWTFNYLSRLQNIERKAIKMQTKWFIIISVILALIGSLIMGSIYGIKYANKEQDVYILIVIISCIVAYILNIVMKLIINLFSKTKERTLNRAFNLNMGEWKDAKNDIISKDYKPRVLYNFGVMYYKVFVIPCTILVLLFISKFDISMTIIITTIYTLISSFIAYSDSDMRGKGGGIRHTAWIKDARGNTTGSIDYY